ncbi:MAG TPA: strawberry notch C-terminal domain-containing protein, partial [Cytophagaceae bacterium]|nr:strawberry notch C-terminal domain-containing protein [Cytophagaceae bacterium]
EGVEVNYLTLENKEEEHKAIADNITGILRDIIGFQTNFIDKEVEELDSIAVAEGKEVNLREGTSQAGVDNQPYFSKVFNVINQMLFSIKAEAVAERAIARLQEGKKPVVAFASTMGSFIEQMENEKGLPVGDGDIINADFSEVLMRGLDGILRYTETEADGNKDFKKFEVSELSPEAQSEYFRISEKIKNISTGITISPIDIVIQKIQKAGYTVAEVTGRKFELQINQKTNQGLIKSRKKLNTNDAFRQFNNNEVDVLLINQSGSTGASAHAIITPKVPAGEVKQRVMIVLQAELDINTEVQKRGRINRTGQIYKPIYDYVNSAIPAEKRLMMMLQKKLKSLDANTTSNQKQSTKILDVPDFLNKYGDKIVTEYLKENPEINRLLDDPLKLMDTENEDGDTLEEAAHRVSGRVAVLSTKMQADFYNEISERYNEYVEYLKQIGEYDLEVETMDLQAEPISERIVKVGKGGDSEFGTDSVLETVRANVLRKPFNKSELDNLIREGLQGKEAKVQQEEIFSEYESFAAKKLENELKDNEEYYAELIKEVPDEKKVKRILEKEGEAAWREEIEKREEELKTAQTESRARIEKLYNNRKQYLDGLFKFFYVGKNINYAVKSFEEGKILIPAVFLGFILDKKKKNPYAPSAIKLRFAIASGNKYVAMPASYDDEIMSIKGASVDLEELSHEELLKNWEKKIKESNTDRNIRYIVSGNLLQAFSQYRGKLVSYTMLDGQTKKGILMPEYWEPEEQSLNKVDVPIERALKIIKSMGLGGQINTNNNISIFRQADKYKIIVPSSKQRGGDVFLNKELLAIVDKNIFEKVADKMVASIPLEKIEKLVMVLQEKFNASVTVSSFQFDLIKDEIPKKKERKTVLLKIRSREMEAEDDIELEAMALELELQLLKFAA